MLAKSVQFGLGAGAVYGFFFVLIIQTGFKL